MFKKGLAIIFIIFFYAELYAQNNSNKPKELFDLGDYEGAFEASKEVLKVLPDDPVYNYYAGASLFHMGYNYNESHEYLDKADSRLTPKDLWLYKGKALLYLYRLEESKRAFELYSQNFSLLDAISGENMDWEKLVDNTKAAVQNTQEIKLQNRDTIKQNSIIDYYNEINISSGQWVGRNDEYYQNLGIQPGEGFYYRFYEKSDDQCFVITGKKGLTRNDLDIYYTCLSGDIFEQTFQALPPFINSRKDQRYPIFIESTQTIYYSTEDDRGLGGYDIYYSTYDKRKNRWGYPKNAGFPINSPFDDFLIGTSKDNGLFIATNRYQTRDNIEVLLVKQGEISEGSTEPKELLARSKFLAIEKPKEIDEDLASAIQKLRKDKPQKTKKETTRISQKEKNIEKPLEPEPFFNEDEYKKQLDYALTLQLKADSVGRLADEKRYKLADVKDQRIRIEEIRAIEKYEAKASEIQKEADIAFAKVRKMELEEEANTSSSNSSSNNIETTQPIITNLSNDFKMYSSSPYSTSNPFDFNYELPKGLLYRIQMGVFSKEISYDYFGGLSPVTGEVIEGRGLKKYYIGLFSNFSEADKALQKVQQQGFIDSFIVSWFNGKKVSINRAVEIEKELAR